MKHWIDRLQQERERQACLAKIFPVLAKELWKQLYAVITDDLTKLRQIYPELIPENVQVNEDQPYSLRLSHHGYLLHLELNISERKLLLQQLIIFTSSGPTREGQERVSDATVTLELSFNEQQQKAQFSLDEQVLFLGDLSELCLRPLVDLRPISISEIIDASAVEEIDRR